MIVSPGVKQEILHDSENFVLISNDEELNQRKSILEQSVFAF